MCAENLPNAGPRRFAGLKSRQPCTRLEERRGFGRLDHSYFIIFGCFIVLELRSELDVEDIQLREPVCEIF